MSSTDQTKEIRTAVWSVVHQIAQEESAQLGKPISTEFIASLAHVVYKQMETFGMDVEAFATHGRRSTINTDDVMLCARRNGHLVCR
ncbi:kinetochore component CENP-S [Halteromyces radiatus]|uniref:kinetochore component CENP-S n=1 Tax=Halteromyces radiatus TaxID=101107 RepID=UPI00221E944A|nr:kinetochore component CENP-S [Halteromyces radiatus]KAI8096181.1 kinetochore component CENP-S [Halteromyces radiatus]